MKLNTFFKKFLAAISLLAVTLTGANAGVTNIIPFGPGGESDVTARMQQPYYKEIYNDGLNLKNIRITNSVRCVPPKNKPTNSERINCRKFLRSEIQNMKNLKKTKPKFLCKVLECSKRFTLWLT